MEKDHHLVRHKAVVHRRNGIGTAHFSLNRAYSVIMYSNSTALWVMRSILGQVKVGADRYG